MIAVLYMYITCSTIDDLVNTCIYGLTFKSPEKDSKVSGIWTGETGETCFSIHSFHRSQDVASALMEILRTLVC